MTTKKKPLVYIAGPLTAKTPAGELANALEAMRIGDKLDRLGFHAFVPHLTLFHQLYFPRPYESWLEMDFRILEGCDALLRLKGPSPGADREVERAKALGIPVFYKIADLIEWRNNART